jgi:hypothetical protein
MNRFFTLGLFITACLFLNTATAQQAILWGGPGVPESEFNGGLNGWTATGITCPDANWVWEADGKADLGAYSAGTGSVGIQSPSVSNGAMVFDSDFYDNGGDPNNQGGGICPSPQIAELVSPIIDLTGAGKLSLKFNQYHRNFFSVCSVAWSMDGGNSWSEPIVVNDNVPVNEQTTRNDVKVLRLVGAEGSSEFRVKFIIEGDYYFWIIDDVQILERERNNMQVNTNWYAIAPNFRTPLSQVEEFSFLADIQNVGGNDQSGVKLNISIKKDSDGSVVYTDNYFYGDVPSDSIVENVTFGAFTPAQAEAKYTATYTISSDSTDSQLGNNTIQWKFEVSDSIFAKEKARTRNVLPADGNWDAGEKHTWAYGNHYYVVKGDGMMATSASFGIANASEIEGQQLSINLYKWEDLNEDGDADPDERILVGGNLYDIQGNESATIPRKVSLVDYIGTDIYPALEDESHYLMMVEFTPTETGLDFLTFASEDYDYGAMVLGSAQFEKPRYAAFLGINDPLDEEPYSSLGFGWDIVPVVRLHINGDFVGTEDQLSEDNLVEVFPNPVADVLNINLSLQQRAEKLTTSIMDANGKVVYRKQYQNISADKLQVPAGNLAPGNYFLFVNADGKSTTRKFVVQ